MKLFVWRETLVGSRSHTGGTIVAMAETAMEARLIVLTAANKDPRGFVGYFSNDLDQEFTREQTLRDALASDLSKEPEALIENAIILNGSD